MAATPGQPVGVPASGATGAGSLGGLVGGVPAAIAKLPAGALVSGTVTGRDSAGHVMLRTAAGSLAIATALDLLRGNVVTLKVRGGPVFALIVELVDGKAPSPVVATPAGSAPPLAWAPKPTTVPSENPPVSPRPVLGEPVVKVAGPAAAMGRSEPLPASQVEISAPVPAPVAAPVGAPESPWTPPPAAVDSRPANAAPLRHIAPSPTIAGLPRQSPADGPLAVAPLDTAALKADMRFAATVVGLDDAGYVVLRATAGAFVVSADVELAPGAAIELRVGSGPTPTPMLVVEAVDGEPPPSRLGRVTTLRLAPPQFQPVAIPAPALTPMSPGAMSPGQGSLLVLPPDRAQSATTATMATAPAAGGAIEMAVATDQAPTTAAALRTAPPETARTTQTMASAPLPADRGPSASRVVGAPPLSPAPTASPGHDPVVAVRSNEPCRAAPAPQNAPAPQSAPSSQNAPPSQNPSSPHLDAVAANGAGSDTATQAGPSADAAPRLSPPSPPAAPVAGSPGHAGSPWAEHRAQGLLASQLAGFSRAWPEFTDLVTTLRSVDPAMAGAVLPRIVPTPGPTLGSTVMFFLSALTRSDLAGWLGRDVVARVEDSGRGDVISRVSTSFDQLARLAEPSASGDWQAFFVPLADGETEHQVRFFIRRNGRGDGTGEDGENTRFIVELNLSRLGEIQLDGLVRENNFDLILRSPNPLGDVARRDLAEIFSEGLEITGIYRNPGVSGGQGVPGLAGRRDSRR